MKRYLIYFSYLGTRFRGLQKQFNKGAPILVDETVQSVLELGLQQLKPINQPVIYPASRTDAGVHALCTAAHVDLVFLEDNKSIYSIVKSLNSFFSSNDFDVRVLSIRIVPNDFSARYSVHRKKYLYRFAVVQPEVLPEVPNSKNIFPFPIIEKDRTHFVVNSCGFDSKKAQEATRLFLGAKDFRAFMGRPHARPDVLTERVIEALDILPAEPFLKSPESKHFDFWEVTCVGRSFLYRQVRRTVGVLLAVGQGKMSLEDVAALFDSPTNSTWNPKAVVVPGHGLYLTSVEYREVDLLLEQNSSTDNVISL